MKAVFRSAYLYLDDAMNLPVKNVEAAIPFYETIMGFQVVSRKDTPCSSAILGRDGIQIGLVENGGDPTQDGCLFEVDNAETAFDELKSNRLEKEEGGFRIDQYGATAYKVVAPDGFCDCLGERV